MDQAMIKTNRDPGATYFNEPTKITFYENSLPIFSFKTML